MTGTALFTPEIKVAADDREFSELAAAFFIAALERLKNPLVVVPTGNTPLGMYDVLATRYAHRRDLWDAMRFLQLDEYAGLAPQDSRLFERWLSKVFLDRVGIPAQNRVVFRSNAANPAQEIARIDGWLAANGPIDLAVLGLGLNGHLGMNEPGSPVDEATRIVAQRPETIKAGAAYWGSEDRVPSQAYTLGLRDLLRAGRILLLVNGKAKAGILDRTLNDAIDADVPASLLRLRPGVTVIADRAAKLL